MGIEKHKISFWGKWWRGAIINLVITFFLSVFGVFTLLTGFLVGSASLSGGVIVVLAMWIIFAPIITSWVIRWVY